MLRQTVIRMNVIFTLFTVMQSLSTLTRKAAGPILFNFGDVCMCVCVCRPFNDQRESYRTPDPVFHHSITSPNAAPIGMFTEKWNYREACAFRMVCGPTFLGHLCSCSCVQFNLYNLISTPSGPQTGCHS